MYKDLQASPFQLACLISVKPVFSLFSVYWSSLIKQRPERLIANITWAGLLGHLPFFFTPLVHNPWFFVLASGIYMLFWRGVVPAWMEILKINVPAEFRQKVFAYSSALYHLGGAVLSIGLGWLLTDYRESWRWLFPLTAIISLIAIAFQMYLPIRRQYIQETPTNQDLSLYDAFKKPWQEAWELLKKRPDFVRFQIGFMLGGGGLMLWQPVLPIFFFDTLHLSYAELATAINFCKGIGYSLSIPFWTRLMSRLNIFSFSGVVTVLAAFFPICLMTAQWQIGWLYAAYLLYGIMQGGSEMSWHLSGPIFAQQEDSSTYSGVNGVSVGLRGCLAPYLGGVLCDLFNTITVLWIGGGLCLMATWQMRFNRYRLIENEVFSPPFTKKSRHDF
jgi:hypothetical protein